MPQEHLFRNLVKFLVKLLLLDLVATPEVNVLNDVDSHDLVARHSCLENLFNRSPCRITRRHWVHLEIFAFASFKLAHRVPPVVVEVELYQVRKLLD
jgi:hypothetical protein